VIFAAVAVIAVLFDVSNAKVYAACIPLSLGCGFLGLGTKP
jgi:hypothetical protein